MKQRGASHQSLSTQSPKSDVFFTEYSSVNDKTSHSFLSNWDEYITK